MTPILLWFVFILFVLGMLAIDLGVFNRDAHAISTPEAAGWTAAWIVLALLFNVGIYFLYRHHALGMGLGVGHEPTGREAALAFFTGYLIEKSLSLDNIFVIALIFSYFHVPHEYQHRVLFWGILGALVMRGVMIAIGVALIRQFEWMVYVFGGLLLVTAVRMFFAGHERIEPDKNPLVRLARRLYRVSGEFDGPRFFTRLNGHRAVTPLFLVLLVVESADVVFAVDSIPAVFAVTRDPFIVFTSNIFAILGLRALYFVLASVIRQFRYLKTSLVLVLAFVGVKMLLDHHYPIPTPVSLAVIGTLVAGGIIASLIVDQRNANSIVLPLADELQGAVEFTWKQVRRFVVFLVGTIVLLLGLAMIILPGPAVVMIPAGLAILATEFLWARSLVSRVRRKARNWISRRRSRTSDL